ncbi:shikimate dehydrogenase [Acidiplasma sp.]|uniref:shikimate dehydrogenase family protein n=1 Tax=Acidiplasma sp. TaxID=1872114 RepID=UPI00258C7A6A|nr:shikimate dehydrogenase [Acidiplasma sp.]
MNASALIGKPVTHSAGQYIYNKIFKKNNINSIYLSIDLDMENIPVFIRFARENLLGFNVTAPYKEVILKYLDVIDDTASGIGAVNLVKNCSGKLYGYNADYNGFLFSLKHNKIDPNGKKILILGTGGTARMVYYALKSNYKCTVFNATRNLENKKNKNFFDNLIAYDELMPEYDIIINCTPVGTFPDIKSPIDGSKIMHKSTAIDMIYNPQKTKFLALAENKGCSTVNGVDLFIGQGLETLKKLYNLSIDYQEFKLLFNEKIIK